MAGKVATALAVWLREGTAPRSESGRSIGPVDSGPARTPNAEAQDKLKEQKQRGGKDGARWTIDSEDLPLSDGQRRARGSPIDQDALACARVVLSELGAGGGGHHVFRTELAQGSLRLLEAVVLALAGRSRGEWLARADEELRLMRARLRLAFDLGVLQEDGFLALSISPRPAALVRMRRRIRRLLLAGQVGKARRSMAFYRTGSEAGVA